MIAGAAIYLTGIYTEDTHKMHFVGLLVSGQGTPKAIHKIISGNETECRVNAMGILLNFVKDHTLPIFVYTDFNDIVRWGNGTQRAVSKRARDFLTYLKKRRNEQEISFQLQIPDAMKQIMMTILQGQTEEQVTLQNPFKKKTVEMETTEVKKPAPEFCVIVNNANGDSICNLNQNDFCGVLKDAVFLANWYESESRNKNSMFYRCVVERKGMLDTVNKYMKGIK
jgi:hypothetical protein